jgi:hypothetical protein
LLIEEFSAFSLHENWFHLNSMIWLTFFCFSPPNRE